MESRPDTALAVGGTGLRIVRNRGWSSLFRAFIVVVDGQRIGKLCRGDDQTFPVSPGQHVVWVKIDWCRSRKLTVDVRPGEVVTLSCRTRPTDLILALWIATFGCHRYPVLEYPAGTAPGWV